MSLLRWLTLYLFLILAILLLAFNLFSFPSTASGSNTLPTPTPTSKRSGHIGSPVPSPSLTPLSSLVANPYILNLQVDPQGLLNDIPRAINNVKQQVLADAGLQGQHAALVIAYGGATDASQSDMALKVAEKVEKILQTLSPKDDVFNEAVYHKPLYVLDADSKSVQLEIYFYTQ